ncbi:hypothetical protein ABK040_004018 [Willaertia magna]
MRERTPLFHLLLFLSFLVILTYTIIKKTILFFINLFRKNQCVFCNLPKEGNVFHYRDDICYIVEDVRPEADFHYLVIPIEHISSARTFDIKYLKTVHHMYVVAKRFFKERHSELFHSLHSNQIEDRFGFHLPPFNSVGHAHMHVLVGKYNNFISRIEFTPDTYWYCTAQSMIRSMIPDEDDE